MNYNAMNLFLSEENIKKHLEHTKRMKLKLSILCKSFADLNSTSIKDVLHSNIDAEAKKEAVELLWYIKSHELFFDSFTETPRKSDVLLKQYSSQEKFLYDLYLSVKDVTSAFLFVYTDQKGFVRYSVSKKYDGEFLRINPLLAIDLFEHTYFWDYGFEKEKFLRAALTHLDLSRLSGSVAVNA